MFENALQFVGAFVAFSIALVAYKGVRETSSSSMLRLAAAFVFLGSGFVLQGLDGVGAFASIPGLEVSVGDPPDSGHVPADSRVLLPRLLPRARRRRVDKRIGPLLTLFPLLAISQTSVETVLTQPLVLLHPVRGRSRRSSSYSKNRNPNTLLIACGLGMLAGGWWVSLAAPDGRIVNIVAAFDEGSWTSRAIRACLEILVQEAGDWLNGPV